MKSRGRFRSFCRNITSSQVRRPMGARSFWCIIRMGPGDSILNISHWTRSLSRIGTWSHGLMTLWTNSKGKNIWARSTWSLGITRYQSNPLMCGILIQSQGGTFQMARHAFQIDKCSRNLHEVYGWHLASIHQLICSGILGWQSDLQPDLGRAPSPHPTSPPNTAATQVVCQFGEVHFWHDPGSISGIHFWWKGGACRSKPRSKSFGIGQPQPPNRASQLSGSC